MRDGPYSSFTSGEIDFFSALCGQAALALENAVVSSRLGELAAARERNRISQEIHDGLAQQITTVILQLEASLRLFKKDPARSETHLTKGMAYARECLADVRQYMFSLRESSNERLQLAVMIKRLVKDFGEQTATPVKLRVEGRTAVLSAPAEQGLLRIARESLTNIRKHAKAKQVEVCLKYEPTQVELRIADNGCGFAADEVIGYAVAEGKLGLLGMQERAGAIGGALIINSRPSKGTEIRVNLPLQTGTLPTVMT